MCLRLTSLIRVRFFNLFECMCVRSTVPYLFVEIISIARVGIFPSFLLLPIMFSVFLHSPSLLLTRSSVVFRLFISCVFYYRLCYLKVCRSTMTTDGQMDGGSGNAASEREREKEKKVWNLWKSEHKINVWKKGKEPEREREMEGWRKKLHSRLHVLVEWMDRWMLLNAHISRITSTPTPTWLPPHNRLFYGELVLLCVLNPCEGYRIAYVVISNVLDGTWTRCQHLKKEPYLFYPLLSLSFALLLSHFWHRCECVIVYLRKKKTRIDHLIRRTMDERMF